MPHGSQHEPDDDNAPRHYWRGEELTNRKEVGDASDGERNDEGRRTPAAEVVRADRQRHQDDTAESVKPARGGEFHSSSKNRLTCATASAHSPNHAAVRGAFAGASR